MLLQFTQKKWIWDEPHYINVISHIFGLAWNSEKDYRYLYGMESKKCSVKGQ